MDLFLKAEETIQSRGNVQGFTGELVSPYDKQLFHLMQKYPYFPLKQNEGVYVDFSFLYSPYTKRLVELKYPCLDYVVVVRVTFDDFGYSDYEIELVDSIGTAYELPHSPLVESLAEYLDFHVSSMSM